MMGHETGSEEVSATDVFQGRFFKVPRCIYDEGFLNAMTLAERSVFFALLERRWGDTSAARVSVRGLAAKAGLNAKTVMKATKGLEEKGFIKKQSSAAHRHLSYQLLPNGTEFPPNKLVELAKQMDLNRRRRRRPRPHDERGRFASPLGGSAAPSTSPNVACEATASTGDGPMESIPDGGHVSTAAGHNREVLPRSTLEVGVALRSEGKQDESENSECLDAAEAGEMTP